MALYLNQRETSTEGNKMKTIREQIADLLTGCKSQTDIDAVVTKNGGIGKICATIAGERYSDFGIEWDSAKMNIKHMTRR